MTFPVNAETRGLSRVPGWKVAAVHRKSGWKSKTQPRAIKANTPWPCLPAPTHTSGLLTCPDKVRRKNSFKGLLCPAVAVLWFFLPIDSLCWCPGGAREAEVSAAQHVAFGMGCCDTSSELKGLKCGINPAPLQYYKDFGFFQATGNYWKKWVYLSDYWSSLCNKKKIQMKWPSNVSPDSYCLFRSSQSTEGYSWCCGHHGGKGMYWQQTSIHN